MNIITIMKNIKTSSVNFNLNIGTLTFFINDIIIHKIYFNKQNKNWKLRDWNVHIKEYRICLMNENWITIYQNQYRKDVRLLKDMVMFDFIWKEK